VDGAQFGVKGVMCSLWPIQMHVWAVAPAGFGTAKKKLQGGHPTHIIGVHHSSTKPESYQRYLRKLTDELIYLDPTNKDVEAAENRALTVRMLACICDTPARNDVKYTSGPASTTFPCEKCFSVAVKVGRNYSSSWTGKHALRSDASFLKSKYHVRSIRNEVTGEVEIAKSPLRELKYFGLVTGFPLDPMHTVYLCGVKNWLQVLFTGNRVTENALSGLVVIKLEKKLNFMKHFVPVEFRSARLQSINHLPKWKAAETRLFILYNAVLLFRGIVEESIINRLCYLVVALYFIGGSSAEPVPEKHLRFAEKLIEKFVSEVARDNFTDSFKPTLHFLLHIVNDCRFHNCHMERLGAWVFESAMRHTLNSVHSGHRAIEQMFNREDERLAFSLPLDGAGNILDTIPIGANRYYTPREDEPTKPHITTNAWKRQVLVFPKSCGNFSLKKTKNNRDCHFIYQYGTARTEFRVVKYIDSCIVEDFDRKDIVVRGQSYRQVEPLFTHPCNSDLFHALKFWDLNPETEEFEAGDIKGKMYAVPSVDDIELGSNDVGDNNEILLKSQLMAYLSSSLPGTAKNAPVQPKMEDVAKLNYDAWVGIGLRHCFDGSASATVY
jgi:hypothetical protein